MSARGVPQGSVAGSEKTHRFTSAVLTDRQVCLSGVRSSCLDGKRLGLKVLMTPKRDRLGLLFFQLMRLVFSQLTGCLPVMPDPGSLSALLHILRDGASSRAVKCGAVALNGVWVHRAASSLPVCVHPSSPSRWFGARMRYSPHFQGIWRSKPPSSLLLNQESLSKQVSEVLCQGDALETVNNLNGLFRAHTNSMEINHPTKPIIS